MTTRTTPRRFVFSNDDIRAKAVVGCPHQLILDV